MDRILEKDRLYLAYQRQLYYLNAVLLLGTVGLLSFIGIFISNKENLTTGFIISVTIFIICTVWHRYVNNNLKNISIRISTL